MHAMRKWERIAPPCHNFRSNNVRAITYGIECDLDHQYSYVKGMLEELRRKNPHWDFELRANNELRDLRQLRDRLDAVELPDSEAAPFLEYMAATEQLLITVFEEGRQRKASDK